jgi:hypothetical protein
MLSEKSILMFSCVALMRISLVYMANLMQKTNKCYQDVIGNPTLFILEIWEIIGQVLFNHPSLLWISKVIASIVFFSKVNLLSAKTVMLVVVIKWWTLYYLVCALVISNAN